MTRDDILNSLQVDVNSFIVEIGGGPVPYRNTKLNLDKYPFENLERSVDILRSAPVVKCDATRIPFVCKCIDLLFISHVIEHLDDPVSFLDEAKRVAINIYLEWPSSVREVVFGWSFHRWLIDMPEPNKLVFYKNDLPQLCGGFFHDENNIFFIEYIRLNHEKMNLFYSGPIDQLEFEISSLSALEYLSGKNSFKIDFPNIKPNTVNYFKRLSSILNLLGKNIIPLSMRKIIKETMIRRMITKGGNIDLSKLVNGRLLCLKCRKVIIDISLGCECGFKFRQIGGLLTVDIEDYSDILIT